MSEYRETIRTARVEGGIVRGIRGNNPVYTVFKGVPYAAPPVGELRWRPPQPVVPWEGVRYCAEYRDIAMQPIRIDEELYGREYFQNTDPRSEDCLYLNIWTSAKAESDRLPVFFWIHGGAYYGGAPSEPEFDGEGFCKRGVIMVSIAYRVGALGFLCHPELTAESPDGVSGNYGMLDQIAALQWVRRNIAAFGGDPDNITIAGQSAGAMSVMTLMTNPGSKGLFRRAIIQSSACSGKLKLLPDRTLKEGERQGLDFMRALDCANLSEMRAVSAERIIEAQTAFSDGQLMCFKPVIDGRHLPCNPSDAVLNDDIPDIDYLCGSTYDEGWFEGLLSGYQIDSLPLSSGNIAFCESRRRHGHRPAYAYSFNRPQMGEDRPGAFHASELWCEFQTLNRCWRPFTGVDYDLSEKMADYWANFVKTGDPNEPKHPTWIPYHLEKPCYMDLSENLGTKALDIPDWQRRVVDENIPR